MRFQSYFHQEGGRRMFPEFIKPGTLWPQNPDCDKIGAERSTPQLVVVI